MTILQRIPAAQIASRSVGRLRRPFHRSIHHHVSRSTPATTTLRCTRLGRRLTPIGSTSHSKRFFSFKTPSGVSGTAAGKQDDVLLKETDFEEGVVVNQGLAEDDGAMSATDRKALDAANAALIGLDKSIEQGEVEGVVVEDEGEVAEVAAPARKKKKAAQAKPKKAEIKLDFRAFLMEFQKWSNVYSRERKQFIHVIFNKTLNPLAFVRAKPNILAKLQEYTEQGHIPECLGVELVQNKFFHSAAVMTFRDREAISSQAKYPKFWTNFWGEGKIFEIHSDDFEDWVQISIVVPQGELATLDKFMLQDILQKENPGIFDDPLGRPQQGHPFACFMGNTADSRDLIRLKIPPASFWKVFQADGLNFLGKHREIIIPSLSQRKFRYKIARIWHSSPNSIGRDNRYLEYNYRQQLSVLETLQGMQDPNDKAERKPIVEILKKITLEAEASSQPVPKQPSSPTSQSLRWNPPTPSGKKLVLKKITLEAEASSQPEPAKPVPKQPSSPTSQPPRWNTPTPSGKKLVWTVQIVDGRLIVKAIDKESVPEAVKKLEKQKKKEPVKPFKEPKAPAWQGLALKSATVQALAPGAKKSKLTPVKKSTLSFLTPLSSRKPGFGSVGLGTGTLGSSMKQ